MSNRDPAAIHPTGLGLLLQDCIADYSTLSAFPTAGIAGRLGRATDSGIVYRDTSAAWEVWVTPGSSGLITNSYYEFVDDGTSTGFAWNGGQKPNLWTASGLSGFNKGTDIALSSGVITVQTTGVYSIAVAAAVTADTPGDTYTNAFLRLEVLRIHEPGGPSVHDQMFLRSEWTPFLDPSSNVHQAESSVSFVGYASALDVIRVRGSMYAAANPGSTWSFREATMYIERLT